MEHEGDSDTDRNWCTWNNLQRIGKGTGRLGNKRPSGDHPDYSFIKISQKTEKSPGDEETCSHSKSSEKPSANTGKKTLKGVE